MPERAGVEALSHGLSRPAYRPQHDVQRQRSARLADLRGLRAASDWHGAGALRRREVAGPRRIGHGLRSRFIDNRSVPVRFSLGSVPVNQGRHQAAHAARSSRQHSLVHPHQQRQDARCQSSRSSSARARCVLRHGSRLSGFRASGPARRCWKLFRDARKIQHADAPALFPSR